jgi:cell division septation protein DedD
VDILVKPIAEEDLVVKTTAVVGDLSAPELPEEISPDVSDEDEPGLFISDEQQEMKEEIALAEVAELMDESQKQDHIYDSMEKILTLDEIAEEGGPDMSRKGKPFDNEEDALDENDLFSEDDGLFSEELKKSFDEVEEKPEQQENEDIEMPEDYAGRSAEEKPANSLRRVLLVAASIIAGIALGVGGYFFFTAGNRQAPPRKEVVRVLPEPAAVSSAPEALSGKPDVIPEVQVKPELQGPEMTQPKGPALQEPAPKAGALKGSPEKSVKESTPVEAAKSGQQEPAAAGKQAKKKKAPAKVITNGKYFVQAGLFENENNAKALIDRIRLKGFPVSVKKVEKTEGKTLYRVTVGSYASVKDARGVSEALNKQGILTIVQRQQ